MEMLDAQWQDVRETPQPFFGHHRAHDQTVDGGCAHTSPLTKPAERMMVGQPLIPDTKYATKRCA